MRRRGGYKAKNQDLNQFILGEWKLDETSGTTVYDDVNGQHLIQPNISSITTTNAIEGTALNFQDQLAAKSESGMPAFNLAGKEGFSMAFWFYPISSSSFMVFAQSGLVYNDVDWDVRVQSNLLILEIYNTDGSRFVLRTTGGAGYVNNSFFHTVISFDLVAQSGFLMINGTLLETVIEGSITDLRSRAESKLAICGWLHTNYRFPGIGDNWKIYEKALTQEEATGIYDTEKLT